MFGAGVIQLFDGPITNCVVSGNADNALAWCGGPVTNCTIVGNAGRGLSLCDGPVSNSIVWANRLDDLWGANAAGLSYCCTDGSALGMGVIGADPAFAVPGYWADPGDPDVPVEPDYPGAVWIEGDYHLKSRGWRWVEARQIWTWDDVTSRCIDSGNPGSPPGEEPSFVQPDPENVWGRNIRINIGAYGGTARASMPPHHWALLSDLTNDGSVDLGDLAAFCGGWLGDGESRPPDLNRDRVVDLADFALFGRDWLLRTSWWTDPEAQ
jgi:hypothetical protein